MFSAEVLGRCLQLPLQQMNLHNIKLQQTQVFVLIKENTLQTAAERNEPSPPINTPPPNPIATTEMFFPHLMKGIHTTEYIWFMFLLCDDLTC